MHAVGERVAGWNLVLLSLIDENYRVLFVHTNSVTISLCAGIALVSYGHRLDEGSKQKGGLSQVDDMSHWRAEHLFHLKQHH